MATVGELQASRSGSTNSVRRRYHALGYADEAAAIAAVHASGDCPSTIDDLERVPDDTTAKEFHNATSSLSDWEVDVSWKLFVPSSGLNYSFQIGGTSIFRYYAISTTNYPVGTAPVVNDAINWDKEQVNGVTLPEKSGFEFVIPARKAVADIDNAYVTAVSDMYLTVNDATFEGFAAGEILFLGMNGSRVGENDWQLYYRFARSDNLTSLDVDGITVTTKEGWEYLWVLYDKTDDVNSNRAPEPAGVYVSQVFNDGDFTDLEL